jgi:gamma-glutamyl-gamma-aminobutyrate hydrolase PuuD
MKQRRVHVVGGANDYASWVEPTHIVNNIKDADLVIFSGGEDVSPEYYGQKPHPMTQSNPIRDRREEEAFQECVGLDKPLLGVCRGAQWLAVMSGAELVQHMRHPSRHEIKTFDGQKLKVTSSHHQCQYPWLMDKADFKLIGWADDLSPIHENGDQKEIGNGHAGLMPYKSARDNLPEVEICYYPDTRALCIQSHPEWMDFSNDEDRKTIHYLRGLLDDLMNFKL